MAQDSFQTLVDAVMYAESRGQRFDPKTGKLLEGPKTRFGTAKGEMQVLDAVMKKPGFGVKPAADESPDERARVGRELLRAFTDKYGDVDTALVAYNWGPTNADKWLKAGADPAKLPSETRKYVEMVKTRLPSSAARDPRTMRVQSAPVPMPASPKATMSQPGRAPVQDVRLTPEMLEQLGPNYQAALAAMTLADSREDDDEESIAEQLYAEKESEREREAAFQSRPNALAGLDLSVTSPFIEEEPAPIQMANGGEVGSPYDYEKMGPTFGQRMGAAVSDVLTKGAITAVDVAKRDRKGMSAAHKIFLDTFGTKGERGPVTKEYFNQDELNAISDLISKRGGDKGSVTYADYEQILSRPSEAVDSITSGKLGPYRSINKSLGQFNYERDPKTGQYRIIDEYDFNPLDRDPRGKPLSPDFAGDYVGENLLDPYTAARVYAGRKMPPGKGRKVELSVPPVRRAEGSPIYGEIATGAITEDTRRALANRQGLSARQMLSTLGRVGSEGVSNLESLARGSVSAIPGVVGDIESGFRDDSARRFATTEEIERQYLPSRLTAPTREAAGFTEVGTNLPLPVDPTRVVRGAQAAGRALAPTAADMLERLGPQPMYAIPRGTPTTGRLVNVDNLLSDYRTMVGNIVPLDSAKYRPMMELMDKKAKDYFYKSYGTGNDPIRKAVKEGQIPMFDVSTFAEYADTVQKSGVSMRDLLGKARMGDEKAIKSFEKLYDDMTGLQKTRDNTGKEYYDLYSKFGSEFPFLSRGQLIESLSTLSPDQLKKLSFPEAVVLGTQNYLKKLDPARGSNVVFFPKKPK